MTCQGPALVRRAASPAFSAVPRLRPPAPLVQLTRRHGLMRGASTGVQCATALGNPSNAARQRVRNKNNGQRARINTAQVNWDHPLPLQPSVAIIGGGASGLACAQVLAHHGIRSTVFDTGEHGVGGRLGTRAACDGSLRMPDRSPLPEHLQGAGLAFDHAAQLITIREPRFIPWLRQWEAAGVLRRWEGPKGRLYHGRWQGLGLGSVAFVAACGMRHLAQHMEQQAALTQLVQFKRPVWVSQMAAVSGKGWQLTGGKADLGLYDAVVIAHNGKCANRLVGPSGAPGVAAQLKRLRLSAVWVLMVAFEQPLVVPGRLEAAYVLYSPVLAWVANNTAKLQLQHPGHPGMQCWTLTSSNAYAQRHKVPQEAVPPQVAHKVESDMLAAFAEALGLPAGSLPRAVFTRCQLWGAALPLNSPRTGCIWDPASRVGVAGDWLLSSGVEAAVLSGEALAERIAATRGVQPGSEAEQKLAHGLTDAFELLNESEIGDVCAAPTAAEAATLDTVKPRIKITRMR